MEVSINEAARIRGVSGRRIAQQAQEEDGESGRLPEVVMFLVIMNHQISSMNVLI